MKKILFFITTLAIFTNVSVFGSRVERSPKKEKVSEKHEADYDWAVTIKNGYFYPRDCNLRNIFCQCGSKGGYWFEGAVRYNLWKRLDIEASGSYFGKKGRALCGCECTKVKIPTFGLGLKYFFNFGDWSDSERMSKVSFFLGAGLRVFFYSEKNDSCYVKRCYKKTTAGGMINFGFEFDVHEDFFIDLFFDYNFKKLKPCCNNDCCDLNVNGTCCPSCFVDLHLGGLATGIGLGYKFNS